MFSLILAVGFAIDLPVRGNCSGGQCSATVSKNIEKKVEVKKSSRNFRIKGRFKRSCS
tara:strand:+ start:2600 stop:2773 length:174 start_codon:yes stop_codon:yes gene_type:complete